MGHKLPTAYPSRRVWLHVSIRDAANALVFESGTLRPNGTGIVPRGFDKSTAGKDIAVYGEAATDPDFVDLGDRIRYDVDVSAGNAPFVVEAELL